MPTYTNLKIGPSCIYKRIKDNLESYMDLKKKHDMQLAELGEETNSYCYKSVVVTSTLSEKNELHGATEEFVNGWE